jgi:hypothetical protein
MLYMVFVTHVSYVASGTHKIILNPKLVLFFTVLLYFSSKKKTLPIGEGGVCLINVKQVTHP